jgi:hypothetical protein
MCLQAMHGPWCHYCGDSAGQLAEGVSCETLELVLGGLLDALLLAAQQFMSFVCTCDATLLQLKPAYMCNACLLAGAHAPERAAGC